MAGLDHSTGRVIGDWPHVVQSIGVILATRIAEREGRRWFGSELPGELGKPLNGYQALRVMQMITVAIELWEPRYGVTEVRPERLTRTGELGLLINGEHFPRGHLGDRRSAGRRSIFLGVNGLEPIE